MPTINEATITFFLAKMSLDVNEQDKYVDYEATYLSTVGAMPQSKKDILISRDVAAIQKAALQEQGLIGCIQMVPNIINYSPLLPGSNELIRDLRRVLRTQVKG